MTLGEDSLLQVTPDSEQHLEFILVGRQVELLDFCESIVDERGVVRGDRDPGSVATRRKHRSEHLVEEFAVIGINVALFLERDTCRFPISAFN